MATQSTTAVSSQTALAQPALAMSGESVRSADLTLRDAMPSPLSLGRPVADQEHDVITVRDRAYYEKNPPSWGELGNPTSPVIDAGASPSGVHTRIQTYENGSLLHYVHNDSQDDYALALPPSATAEYIQRGGPAYFGTFLGGPSQAEPSLYGTTTKVLYFDSGRGYLYTNGEKSGAFFHVRNLTFYPAYKQIGEQKGQMGLPTSNEYRVKEGLRQDFEGGYLLYNLDTSKIEVYR
jgi:hypothetical protein